MSVDSIQLPSDFSTITDDQLGELDEMARAAAAPLAAKAGPDSTDEITDAELTDLRHLATVVEGVSAERSRRLAEASSGAVRASQAAAAAAVFAADTKTDAKAEPEKPAAKPLVKPSVGQVAAASGGTGSQSTETVQEDGRQSYTKLVAASGVPTVTAGTEFKNWKEIGVALEAAMSTFSGLGANVRHSLPVLQIRRDYPPELRISAGDNLESQLDKLDAVAKSPFRAGESLVAAAGWCAPSQILYDLYEVENGTAGLVDVPELQISRGGIQFTPGPDFSSIWGGAGYWHQTEAQVQAATSKPTMSITCPSFTEKRLEVEGVQITGAFLQDRGYPELVSRFGRGAMIAHARKLNIFKINAVVTGSTAIDYTNVANMPVTTSEYKDLTAVSRALSLIGFQAMDYRYRYRMDPQAVLEVWLPIWFIESAMSDVQRRFGLSPSEAFATTQAMLTDWFSNRYLRVQWLYDWQDAFNTAGVNTNNLGSGVTQLYTLPTTVYAVMYAPGTWIAGVADVIRLDTVYDSTNLALNQYIQLFTEEGILMAKRGYESRSIKLTIDPSGTTSATTNMVTG